MRLLAIILLGFLWCNLSAQVDPEQIYQAPGRDYVLLSTDTLNSSYPINGIYVPTRLRDSFYFKSDSICIGIFGDGRPDPCLLLPESGGGPSDTMYYWVFQVNGGTNDTIIQGEHINLVAGTNISITGGTDNPTINAVNMFDTCFHTLTQLTDTTAQLTDCNGADRGTVTFSAGTSVGAVDSCLQDLIVSNGIGSDTIFLTDCAGANKDTVVFYPPEVNDSYIDSSFVSYNPDSISIWLYRFDTSGLIDSFPIYLPRDSMDTDSQSLDLTGNTLSITRGNSVDLSGYLDDSDTYTDSASVWFNDTVIVFRFDQDHNLVDSFPIRIPKTSFIEHDSDWLEIPTYDVPFSVEDPIFSGSTTSKRLRIGQDSLETNFNVLINGGAGPLETASSLSANLWRQRSRSTNEFWDRAQQSGFLYFRGGDTDLGSNGIYLSMQQGYSGDSVLFSIANGQIGMRQYPNYRVDGDMDDVIALYYPDALGNLNIAPVDTMKRVLADWDFVHLQDGDTSYYSSNQRDSLLPLDTSSLDSLLWRPGIVRLGDTMFYKIAYDTGGFGGGFRQEYKPQFQIANKINAIDIYHWYYPYVWIRNDKSDFWIRNHNNDNTVDTLPSFLEIGAESWYDSTGTEFTSDTSNRRILRISSQSNPGAFEIHRGYIKLGDYTPNDIDTSINSTGIEAVYIPKSDGTIALTSLDTLNAALSVAASTPNITLFDRYNTGDSIALNLNATPDTAFADLSWLKVTLTGDTLIQGTDTLFLPQGADSLGTAFTADRVLVGDGTRAGTISDSLVFLKSVGRLGIGTTSPQRDLHIANAANAYIRIDKGSGTYGEIRSATGQLLIEGHTPSGNSIFDFAPLPDDGSGNAAVRYFRTTNTSGASYMDIHVGNGTSASNARIAGSGFNSFLVASSGNLGIGTQSPGAKMHVDGTVRLTSLGTIGATAGLLVTDADGDVGTISPSTYQPAGSYDNYSSWTAGSGSGTRVVTSGSQLDFLGGDSDISTSISGSTVTFSIPANAIQGSEISDATIEEVDLGVTNDPTDNWLLSYDAGTGGFTWVNPSGYAQTFSTSSGFSDVHTVSLSGTGSSFTISAGSNITMANEGTSNVSINAANQLQTLSWNSGTSELTISSGNTVTLSGISTTNIYNTNGTVTDGATRNLTLGSGSATSLNFNDNGGSNILNMTSSGSGTMTVNVDPDIGANGGNQLHVGTASTYMQIGHEDNMTPDVGTDETYIRFYDDATLLQRIALVNTAGIVRVDATALNVSTQTYTGSAVTAPVGAYALYVNGTQFSTSATTFTTSDSTVKRDIVDIENPFEKINELRPVTYRYKDDYLKENRQDDVLMKGFIAQDYSNVFPEDVIEDESTGRLAINSMAVAPYTVAAVQQLIKDNQQQAAQIKVLTEQINKLYDIVNKKK